MPYPTAQHTHHAFPSPVSGYRLHGRWEVVEPIGANVINLVSNPSLEIDSTGYSAQGAATIARDSTDQRRGVYSLKVTPTSATLDGAYYATVSLVGRSVYTFAFDFKGAGGVKYRFYAASTANNAISPVTSFIATGRWQRVYVTFREPNTAGLSIARRLYVTKDYSTSTASFRLDGLSVTATAYPVTYFDGDSIGFIVGRLDFYWNGTRHGSTSTMANYTRAGGRIRNVNRYGLTLLALLGLGMQPILNISTPQALIGGSQYQRTVSLDRVFDLAGAITGKSLQVLQSNRRKLLDLFKPDATPTDTPLLLLYTPVDECGEALGETLEIPCVYESGLEGTLTNHYQENVGLRFHSFLPYLANGAGGHGQTLAYQKFLSSSPDVFSRDNTGNWTALGLNAAVNAILSLPDGRVLVGGAFTNAGGDANADRLAVYDYNTGVFSSLNATPLNGDVYALALLPDGNRVLVGGTFTDAGGNPTADYLCILNLTTGAFSAVNLTPLSAFVISIAVLQNGDALIGGAFSNAGGNADADNLCKLLSGSTFAFTALNATPLNSQVNNIAVLFNGDAVFSGIFTNAGGDANADFIAYLTTSTGAYSALNTSPLASADGLAVGLDGKLYIGSADAYSWSGPGAFFQELGGGLTGVGTEDVIALPDGDVVFSGEFTAAGGLSLPGPLVGWNGSSFYFMDLSVITGVVSALGQTQDGKFLVSTSGLGQTVAGAAVTTVTNTGPHDAYPIFEMVGPGSVYQIKNYSTNEALYFNLTLNSGERAILDLTPGRIRFYSNFRPNLLGTILPGSDLATFRLVPGSNSISLFIAGTVNAATAATIRWRDCHWAIDSAVEAP